VAFQDTPDNSGHISLATVGEVGALYGLAYDSARGLLYAAAYHKRNSMFGPLGPGGVYAIDVRNGGARPFLTVPNAGPDIHDRSNNYQPDEPGRAGASLSALGDIELSSDGSQLLVMNLAERSIYRFAVSDGQLLGSFAHGAASQAWADDARPFGLAVRGDWLYHGVVNSRHSDQTATDLSAHVYASRLDGSNMQEVLVASLNYDRGRHERWRPWPQVERMDVRQRTYAHPLLTDIEFDAADNMILGLRDRHIDTGPSLTETYRIAPGDILWAPQSGSMQWTFDPAAPEHFSGDALAGFHDEIAIGGLVRPFGRDALVTTAIDPLRTLERNNVSVGAISSGALWLDGGSGQEIAREELVFNTLRHSGPYGKGVGLGDLEMVCAFAQPATDTPVPSDTPLPTATPLPATATTGVKQASPTATSVRATAQASATAHITRQVTATVTQSGGQQQAQPTPAVLPSAGGPDSGGAGAVGWTLLALGAALQAIRRLRRTASQAAI
jgi:hypothetical protein